MRSTFEPREPSFDAGPHRAVRYELSGGFGAGKNETLGSYLSVGHASFGLFRWVPVDGNIPSVTYDDGGIPTRRNLWTSALE